MLDDTKPTRQRAAPEPTGTGQNAVAGWLEGMHALSGEMSELAQARMRFVTEAWSDLAACRNLEQIIACNARLTNRATEHFTGEMTKFAQLMAKMALLRPPER